LNATKCALLIGPPAVQEFKTMVKVLHMNGIEGTEFPLSESSYGAQYFSS
jgi:hypothetical protein